MAEVVGNLGTAGFMGMVVGPIILDSILGTAGTSENRPAVSREQMNQALLLATVAAIVATTCSFWGTLGDGRWRRRRHPPIFAVVRRYQPGAVLLVAAATGFGLGLPSVFLRPFLEERGIGGIAPFFAIYPAVALVTRLSVRRFPERYGVRPMILVGMAFLVVGSMSYLLVYKPWHAAAPAALLGVAHAVLFPSVMAAGTAGYPLAFRGVAMALVLAAFDVGSLIGMPAAGSILEAAKDLDWPRYPTMFLAVAGAFLAIAAIYWGRGRKPAMVTRQTPLTQENCEPAPG